MASYKVCVDILIFHETYHFDGFTKLYMWLYMHFVLTNNWNLTWKTDVKIHN